MAGRGPVLTARLIRGFVIFCHLQRPMWLSSVALEEHVDECAAYLTLGRLSGMKDAPLLLY